jgi:dihydroflavonol-4-reductase
MGMGSAGSIVPVRPSERTLGAVAGELLAVTGATGLVGSNICKAAVAKGYKVRGIVRSPADAVPLKALGVELAEARLEDRDALDRAVSGARMVAHAAGKIGGMRTKTTPEELDRVNFWGTMHVLDAAECAGVERVALVSSYGVFDWGRTLTETAEIVPIAKVDILSTAVKAKRAAFYEGLARASRGKDVRFVIPGCIYGPAPVAERALAPTSFNTALVMALQGTLTKYLSYPLLWSFAEDVAQITLLALERGEFAGRYLSAGAPEDAMSLARFCNMAAAIAGIAHRVVDEDPREASPEEYGTMLLHAQKRFAEPLCDPSRTTAELGRPPTPLHGGLEQTVSWLRTLGHI